MKFISLALIASSILSLVQGQSCTSSCVRTEIRSLPASQWSIISSTFTRMQTNGWIQWYAYLHANNFGLIHGNSMFFPFHRRFVLDFETTARTYFNSGFCMPYWDSARDYASPQNSGVLTSKYIGGNGGSNGCVTTGLQANTILTYPNRHCLSRRYNGSNGTIRTWYSPEFILSRLTSDKTMTAFRPDIEYSIHGAVHVGLGGDMNTTPSPNDFAFFLHHANIDRIWWEWQNIGSNLSVMDGPDSNGRPVTLSSNIPYYNTPIGNLIRLGTNGLCYSYDTGSALPAATGTATPNAITAQALLVNNSATARPSSSTTPASEAAAAANISRQLAASNQTNQLFPTLPVSAFPLTSSLTRRNKVPSKFNPNRKLMPQPGPIDLSWIRMHKYNITEVLGVYNNACDLAKTLNDIGYNPLYV